MPRTLDYLPRIAIFLAGVAATDWTWSIRLVDLDNDGRLDLGMDPAALQDLKSSLANLETRLTAQDTATTARFAQVEVRLEEHSAKLAEVPSTAQIVVQSVTLAGRLPPVMVRAIPPIPEAPAPVGLNCVTGRTPVTRRTAC